MSMDRFLQTLTVNEMVTGGRRVFLICQPGERECNASQSHSKQRPMEKCIAIDVIKSIETGSVWETKPSPLVKLENYDGDCT